MWLSVWSEVQTWIWPGWYHCHSLSLASVKSWLVLPFWYWLTWVVLDNGPLNGCSSSSNVKFLVWSCSLRLFLFMMAVWCQYHDVHCQQLRVMVIAALMQVILGRTHVVSGTGADKLEPSVTADCHTSSLTLSPLHGHATQAIHSQVCCLLTRLIPNLIPSWSLVWCHLTKLVECQFVAWSDCCDCPRLWMVTSSLNISYSISMTWCSVLSPHQPAHCTCISHLCSATSQHSLIICGDSYSATCILFLTSNWLFLLLCFTLSMESTPDSLMPISLFQTRLVLHLTLSSASDSPMSPSTAPYFYTTISKPTFSTNPSHCRLFASTDSRQLPLLLGRMVFIFFVSHHLPFLFLFIFWFHTVDYAGYCQLASALEASLSLSYHIHFTQ